MITHKQSNHTEGTKNAPVWQTIDSLNEQSRQQRFGNIEEAYTFAKEAYTLAVELPSTIQYPKGIADSLINLCWFDTGRALYDEAYQKAVSAKEIYESLDEANGVVDAIACVGRIQFHWGDYSDSLNTTLEQLYLSSNNNYKAGEMVAYAQLGNIYARIENHEQAKIYLECAQGLAHEIGCVHYLLISQVNISLCLTQMNRLNEALRIGHQALTTTKELGVIYLEGRALFSLGQAHIALGNYESARGYFIDQLSIATNIKNDQQLLDALLKLSTLAIKEDKYDDAQEYLESAITIAETAQIKPHLYQCHEQLASLYKQQGEFETALDHHEQYHLVKESVFNKDKERKFKSLEVKFLAENSKKEAEIYRLKTEELEQRVQERTRALNTLNQELEQSVAQESELSKLRSQVIETVSHEFRTPLTIICNSTDLLTQYGDQLPQDNQAIVKGRIDQSIQYLTQLLDGIALVNETNSDTLDLSESSMLVGTLFEMIKQIFLTKFALSADRINFVLEGKKEQYVHIDHVIFIKIASIFLSNAINFSLPDSPITLTVTYDNERLSLQVSDHGIGLVAGEEDLIWDLFYRGSNIDERRGIGIGLYIAKKLSEAMQGTISAETIPSTNTTTFTLKINAADKSAPFALETQLHQLTQIPV